MLWHRLLVDSTTWDLLVAPLAAERRPVIIDGPDHGGSPPVRHPFTLDDHAGAAVSSFARLTRARLALLPAPTAADAGHWLRTRSEGGPRSRPRDEHTVRMNFNRVHPLLLKWAGTTSICARSAR